LRRDIHDVVPKWLWFVLFNVAAIAYLIFTNTLRWTTVSLSGCAIALSLINGSAWLSARRYKNWK
jgi:hypothetical protein